MVAAADPVATVNALARARMQGDFRDVGGPIVARIAGRRRAVNVAATLFADRQRLAPLQHVVEGVTVGKIESSVVTGCRWHKQGVRRCHRGRNCRESGR